MGNGIAIPHARLVDLEAPFALILRSVHGIPCAGTSERAHLMFALLTPTGQPRVHQALLQISAFIITFTLQPLDRDRGHAGRVLKTTQ